MVAPSSEPGIGGLISWTRPKSASRMSHVAELSQRRERPTQVRHNFLTLLCVVLSDRKATLRQMSMTQLFTHRKRSHTHTAVRTYVVSQRLGVPYEVERTVCAECRRLLEERPLKRAAA